MKGATKQLHLGIEAEETEVKEREFNQEFLVKMMERLEWSAFVAAAKTVSKHETTITAHTRISIQNSRQFRFKNMFFCFAHLVLSSIGDQ